VVGWVWLLPAVKAGMLVVTGLVFCAVCMGILLACFIDFLALLVRQV
jgi:hypothetical protein